MAWVADLELKAMRGDAAHLQSRPGKRNVSRFARKDHQRQQVADILKQTLGRAVRVLIDEEFSDGPNQLQPPGPETNQPADSYQDRRREAENLPIVQQVMETFDARVIDVREASYGDANAAENDEPDEPLS